MSHLQNKLCETEQSQSTVAVAGLLGGTDGERPEDPGVHPPDQRYSPGHDLLPLVLGVLPHHLPGLLASLQAGVAPDVLDNKERHSNPALSGSYLDLVQVPDL